MKKALVDVAERAGWTFVQAFAAALTVGSFTDVSALRLAGIAGAYSVVKYLGVQANAYLAKPAPAPPVVYATSSGTAGNNFTWLPNPGSAPAPANPTQPPPAA